LPAAAATESAEFDQQLRRALFHRAAARVQAEVQPATWQAFRETAVAGKPAAAVAQQLGMTVGAVRVAKCRVLVRLRAVVKELEQS
jgi:RNA polymerase sigma-70 factor (ECF subfamily)